MTVEGLQTMEAVCWMVAGIFFVITVVLFFVLKVPELIGELSGTTARKGIAAIRQNTEESDGAMYRAKKRERQRNAAERVNITEKLQTEKLVNAGRKDKAKSEQYAGSNETTKLNLNAGNNETTKLNLNAGNNGTAKAKFEVNVEMGFAESKEIIE